MIKQHHNHMTIPQKSLSQNTSNLHLLRFSLQRLYIKEMFGHVSHINFDCLSKNYQIL